MFELKRFESPRLVLEHALHLGAFDIGPNFNILPARLDRDHHPRVVVAGLLLVLIEHFKVLLSDSVDLALNSLVSWNKARVHPAEQLYPFVPSQHRPLSVLRLEVECLENLGIKKCSVHEYPNHLNIVSILATFCPLLLSLSSS